MFNQSCRLIHRLSVTACIIEKRLFHNSISVRSRSRSRSKYILSQGKILNSFTETITAMPSTPKSPLTASLSSSSTCESEYTGFMGTPQTTSNDNPFVVCVEGNIGCGKTTLLNYFEKMSDCEVIAEPVDKWRRVGDYNPLGMMYQDPARWAMALQTYVQLTMVQIHTRPISQKVRLMERSIFSAKYCFVDNMYKSGIMHEMEYSILSKWFDWILEAHKIQVDLIVYLRTDPVRLHQRIMKRCRKEEENIPVEYLKTLHQCHEDWLVHKKIPCPAEVLVLDADASLEQMKVIYEQHKSNILNARLQKVQSSG